MKLKEFGPQGGTHPSANVNSITADRVLVSAPPLNVSTTQTTVIEWQSATLRSLPPPKILGQ